PVHRRAPVPGSGNRRGTARRRRGDARRLPRAFRCGPARTRGAPGCQRHPPCRVLPGPGAGSAAASAVRRPRRGGVRMSLALLLPAALAALGALLLPLLVHLARRSEQRPTDFAALRWLRRKPRPRRRIRFDERWLLALRLLLLALIALWLARPVL